MVPSSKRQVVGWWVEKWEPEIVAEIDIVEVVWVVWVVVGGITDENSVLMYKFVIWFVDSVKGRDLSEKEWESWLEKNGNWGDSICIGEIGWTVAEENVCLKSLSGVIDSSERYTSWIGDKFGHETLKKCDNFCAIFCGLRRVEEICIVFE